MLITAARETTARPFATPHHPSKSTSALESFVRSNPTHSVEKMRQIARLRQKLPTELPQTDLADIEAQFGRRTAEYVDWLTKPAASQLENLAELSAAA